MKGLAAPEHRVVLAQELAGEGGDVAGAPHDLSGATLKGSQRRSGATSRWAMMWMGSDVAERHAERLGGLHARPPESCTEWLSERPGT